MIDYNLTGKTKYLKKVDFAPNIVKHLSEVGMAVIVDEDKHVHEFTEFDSVFHLVHSIEDMYKNHDLFAKVNALGLSVAEDCFHYHDHDGTASERKWTFGSDYPTREKTRDALMNSAVTKLMWNTIDRLRDSLLKDKLVLVMIDMAPSIKKRKRYGPAGDELCLDRALSGDPNHWQYTSQGQKAAVVRIGLNISMSASNDQDTFLKITSLAAVAAELVMKTGVPVEFILLAVSQNVQTTNPYKEEGDNYKGFAGTICTVKKAEEPFDLARIACLGIPGLFRHYMFMARTCFLSGRVNESMGIASVVPQKVYDILGLKHVIEVSTVAVKDGDEDGAMYKQVLFLKNIFESVSGVKIEEEQIY